MSPLVHKSLSSFTFESMMEFFIFPFGGICIHSLEGYTDPSKPMRFLSLSRWTPTIVVINGMTWGPYYINGRQYMVVSLGLFLTPISGVTWHPTEITGFFRTYFGMVHWRVGLNAKLKEVATSPAKRLKMMVIHVFLWMF